MPAKNAKQEQPEEPQGDPRPNERLLEQKPENGRPEHENPRAAQQQEPELEHDPAHAEPEPGEPAEAAAEADREVGVEQAEADADKRIL
jgi:hypothetical protein